MPKMNIKRSIYIDAKPEAVYSKLNDFHHWEAWSPWLITEKGVKVDVNDDGKYYSWKGNRVGEGNMTVISEAENSSVNYDLMFLKPWKSKAKVGFDLKPEGEGTNVTWTMDSSLPFFLFWMKKMTEAFVGMDYERGLRMLRDYVQDGKVHSELDFKGGTVYNGCDYIGIKKDSRLDQMGENMASDFTELNTFLTENNIEKAGNPVAIYHKWDMVNKRAVYTSAIPVNSIPANLSGKIVSGSIPKTNVQTVGHKGFYEHVGNAWTTAMGMQRAKEFKQNKAIDPFEEYFNDPHEVPAAELITEVHIPMK